MNATRSPLSARAPIVLAGCGKLGRRLGLALAEQHPVWAIRRNAGRIPAPIHPIGGDLTDPDSYRDALPASIGLAIYCLSPSRYDDEGYREAFVTGLDRFLSLLESRGRPPRHVLFASSTGVYHQDDDSWVTERSATRPSRFSGKRLLEAEERLAASPIDSTAVRFSGIYGPGRTGFLEGVRAGRIGPEPPGGFTNRIHEDDCVGVLVHLVEMLIRGHALAPCYLASDSAPIRRGDLAAWIRSQLACEPVQAEAGKKTGRGAGSKRCNNARLLETGYRFRYPSYREGYGELIRALSESP